VIRARKAQTAEERAQHTDVLSLLLAEGFDGKPLRDHAMTILIAGHETTGTTLSFLWAHVARRPDLQERLCGEGLELGGDTVDLERLPLTDAVWKETLRLYPAVPILDRLAVEDVDLCGYRLPRGANVLWSPYVMQRSPKLWPHRGDPNEFMPEAFLSDPPPLPGAFVPFGEGPRMCLGKGLADMEALTIVSLFSRAFRIAPAQPGDIEMETLVTLRPAGGVPVRLSPRSVPVVEPVGELVEAGV
jgi:cytochrome P450